MASRRTDRERELDDEITHLELLADAAETAKSFSAAVAARREAAKLKDTRARMKGVRIANSKRDQLQRLQGLRRLAESDGSWVAARQYADTEAKLSVELLELARQKEADELAEVPDDGLIAEIVNALAMMPMDKVVLIRDAAASRLTGDAPTGPPVAEA